MNSEEEEKMNGGQEMNAENEKMMGGQEMNAENEKMMGGQEENNDDGMEGGRRRRRGSRRKMRGGQNNLLANKPMNGGAKKGSNNNNNNQDGGAKKGSNNNNDNQDGGAKKIPAVGSHAQVWNGTCRHTSGGLTRKDLMKNKHGRIVSRKKHALGKKALKHLKKSGFVAKKGTFKLFRKK